MAQTYITVTGPTHTYTDLRMDGTKERIPSFTDKLNALLERLERDGARNVTVTGPYPYKDSWHVAYVAHGRTIARETMTVAELATRSGVSVTAINQRIRDGSIRTINFTGRRHLIPLTEAEKFLTPTP